MSNNKEKMEMRIKELKSMTTQDVGMNVEGATELVQLKDKFYQMEQAFNDLKNQTQLFSQAQQPAQNQPQPTQAQAQEQLLNQLDQHSPWIIEPLSEFFT